MGRTGVESLRMPASIYAPMEAPFSPRTCAPDAQGIQEHLASRTKAAATTIPSAKNTSDLVRNTSPAQNPAPNAHPKCFFCIQPNITFLRFAKLATIRFC